MSPFAHGAYALRCRVCEEVTGPEALDACRRCDGPTDVAYDWQHISRDVTRVRDRSRASVAVAVRGASPDGAQHVGVQAGWTPLERVDALSELLEHRSPAEARRREPDGLVQGPDRHDRRRRRARTRHDDSLLLVDRQPRRRGCRGRRGNGLEAIVLAPAEVGAGTVAARAPGGAGLRGHRHLRRLPPPRAGARRALPVGLRQRQPAPVRERGREDDLVRDRRAARLGAPGRGRLPRCQRHALRETRAGLLRADARRARDEPVPRLFAGQSEGSSPIADAFADDRRISRVEAATDVPSLAVGNPSHGDLALGAARATGGAVLAVSEAAIADIHGRCSPRPPGSKPTARAAPRSALSSSDPPRRRSRQARASCSSSPARALARRRPTRACTADRRRRTRTCSAALGLDS